MEECRCEMINMEKNERTNKNVNLAFSKRRKFDRNERSSNRTDYQGGENLTNKYFFNADT